MNRRTVMIITFTLTGLGILLMILFYDGDEKKYNWSESYDANSNQPYGTLFIKELVKGNHAGPFEVNLKKPLRKVLKDEAFQQHTDYIFVGSSLYLSTEDKTALLDFISNGNNAFIATTDVPEIVTDLYARECGNLITLDENNSETATLNFYHPSLHDKYGYKYSYRVSTEDFNYSWKTFNKGIFCDSTKNLTALGYNEGVSVNFMKINYGNGALYLHCNPIVFTNYFLIKKEKAAYAAGVFSHLNGKTILWDEFGKMPMFGGGGGSDNPLYFIMKQRSLKYAWWILVIAVILYVFFAAKRTQRIIPVLEAKTNTSLEFVKLISALHFQNSDHLDMARKKMKYFQYFIRSKYGIHINPFTEEIVVKISEKSKVPLTDVKAIFNLHKLIEEGSGGSIEAPRLANFYYAIENFYKQCK